MFRLLALVLIPTLCCLAADEKKSPEAAGEFPKPADGKPWKDEQSGIQLPQTLGHMVMEGGHRYETPDLGISMRYVNGEGRARADIYVYPCKKPHGSDEEKADAVGHEAGIAIGEVKEMETRGRYTKVDVGEGETRHVPINFSEKTAFVEVPMSYQTREDSGAGAAPTAVRSRLGLTVVGDHYLKVRYTYPEDRGEAGDKESEEWMKKVRVMVSEPYLRQIAEDSLKLYTKDPFSREGVAAATNVVNYAEVSPFVSMHLPSEIVQWGEACNKVVSEGQLHLLRAYIVGGVEASLAGKTGDEVVEAAMSATAALYKKLQKDAPGLKVDELEKLVAAVDAKKGAEFYKKLESISKLGK